MPSYGVIVVGAGHAGIEAAQASARMGVETLLITMNADQIGAMSCNPAIGGLGKSQLAREVDALGGVMCRIADQSAMQYRLLNESKGAAVRATRVQTDRHEYKTLMKDLCESTENLSVKQGQVQKLLFEGSRLIGLETSLGQKFFSEQIVITTGTFMNGKAHIGRVSYASGRAGEPPSVGLSDYLASIGIRVGRLKTGTVPRIDRRTIDISKIEEQESHTHCGTLSFFSEKMRDDLRSAHIAYTSEATHEIIRGSLADSPLYSGIIESRGPRYCPSVEDKIVRFADKSRHQVFLEREGRQTQEVYCGGLSTSLPYDCQLNFLRSIVGLEKAEIIRPGYAIEYDYIDSTQLSLTLGTKELPGLFFAGQVNGTSGYEEAAAQGIYAGINAALRAKNEEPFTLTRNQSYIGVMVDDLVTRGTKEPYRMFTSRAEWRLLLRQDNAHRRLTPLARAIGAISDADFQKFEEAETKRRALRARLDEHQFVPNEETNQKMLALNEAALKTDIRAADLLRRPGLNIHAVLNLMSDQSFQNALSAEDFNFVETEIKYEGYIDQAKTKIHQIDRLKVMKIPNDFEFNSIKGLTREVIEKLSQTRPLNLDQASRISGVTPAAISILAIHLSRRFLNKSGLKFAASSCSPVAKFDSIEVEDQSSVLVRGKEFA